MAPNSNEKRSILPLFQKRSYQVLQARVGDPTTHPPSPPAVSARNWTKYNKSLKDPVRRAGSAQVQIRSYGNRQSGNLARKVRNAFPMCKALTARLCVNSQNSNKLQALKLVIWDTKWFSMTGKFLQIAYKFENKKSQLYRFWEFP